MLNIMEKSIQKISWDDYRIRLNENSTWTLVHGDYHPAN